MAFTTGDKVVWRSQAGGCWRTKHGEVIEVVPPRRKARTIAHSGLRDHESYVVRATPDRPKAKAQTYWPRAAALEADR